MPFKLRELSKKSLRYLLANPTIEDPDYPPPGCKPMGEARFSMFLSAIISDPATVTRLKQKKITTKNIQWAKKLPVPVVKLLLQEFDIEFQ